MKSCRTLNVIFLLLVDRTRVNELLVCSKKQLLLYFLFSKGTSKQDLMDLRMSSCYPAVKVARGTGCVQGHDIGQCFPCDSPFAIEC